MQAMGESELIGALDARVKRREERRAFFGQALGAAALGGAMLTAGRAGAQTATPTPTPSPTATSTTPILGPSDYLNFALNLEYLEANFYAFATTGAAIASTLQGGVVTAGVQGAATGGRAVNFTDPVVAQYAREIAADELAHVTFLRSSIGAVTVAQPAIDLSPAGAFTTAARAAGLVGGSATFDPYSSDENFLLASFLFEDVGVTAYKSTTALLTSTLREAAQGILATEAYHAAMIRGTLYRKGIQTPSLGLIEAAQKISDARDTLDGSVTENLTLGYAPDDDQGITPTTNAAGETVSNIVPLNSNGLAYSRTSDRVLNILYLNRAAVTSGGFFPAGVNGAIKTSAAAT
ncbi:ferritin-like domain-containing protein [uncultured Sphingomonas sp.]|uniref:ferritin-like domain-containing protein n=1 Tax=uncultured Sphingomonas sp. TaxID=158754 RepID=UPI0025F20572|nr:ferritin-like domain-containing protein [uncultured Sphingomonas sp.]